MSTEQHVHWAGKQQTNQIFAWLMTRYWSAVFLTLAVHFQQKECLQIPLCHPLLPDMSWDFTSRGSRGYAHQHKALVFFSCIACVVDCCLTDASNSQRLWTTSAMHAWSSRTCKYMPCCHPAKLWENLYPLSFWYEACQFMMAVGRGRKGTCMAESCGETLLLPLLLNSVLLKMCSCSTSAIAELAHSCGFAYMQGVLNAV